MNQSSLVKIWAIEIARDLKRAKMLHESRNATPKEMNYQENLTHPLQFNYAELIRTVEITDVHGGKKSTYAYSRSSRFRRMNENHDQKKVSLCDSIVLLTV